MSDTSPRVVRLRDRQNDPFHLQADWAPAGDQPEAIRQLVEGLNDGLAHQTLLGVTGSGKTFTIANVIAQVQRPTLIMAPNKTLAGQLYGEFKDFFPNNAVEYFVSYYDYYQPEAYVPSSDTYIEKDSAVNEHIEQMRLSATKALMTRKDAIKRKMEPLHWELYDRTVAALAGDRRAEVDDDLHEPGGRAVEAGMGLVEEKQADPGRAAVPCGPDPTGVEGSRETGGGGGRQPLGHGHDEEAAIGLGEQPRLGELGEPPLHRPGPPPVVEPVRVHHDAGQVLQGRAVDRVRLVEHSGAAEPQLEGGVAAPEGEVCVLPAVPPERLVEAAHGPEVVRAHREPERPEHVPLVAAPPGEVRASGMRLGRPHGIGRRLPARWEVVRVGHDDAPRAALRRELGDGAGSGQAVDVEAHQHLAPGDSRGGVAGRREVEVRPVQVDGAHAGRWLRPGLGRLVHEAHHRLVPAALAGERILLPQQVLVSLVGDHDSGCRLHGATVTSSR